MTEDEKVLCLARASLPPAWVGERVQLALSFDDLRACLRGAAGLFLPRSQAELDPTHKQLIPYLLVQDATGACTAVYRRNGSERRLHDLYSIGIGGHIVAADRTSPEQGLEAVILAGLRREMDEEFRRLPDAAGVEFLGIINEERSDVGRVHLGLVFRLEVARRDTLEPGEELCDFRWIVTSELGRLRLEHWSQLALTLLPDPRG